MDKVSTFDMSVAAAADANEHPCRVCSAVPDQTRSARIETPRPRPDVMIRRQHLLMGVSRPLGFRGSGNDDHTSARIEEHARFPAPRRPRHRGTNSCHCNRLLDHLVASALVVVAAHSRPGHAAARREGAVGEARHHLHRGERPQPVGARNLTHYC